MTARIATVTAASGSGGAAHAAERYGAAEARSITVAIAHRWRPGSSDD